MTLDAVELVRLFETVFRPGPAERSLLLLVDLPDRRLPDSASWAARRELAAGWHARLRASSAGPAFDPLALVAYPNVRSNNADLPARGWRVTGALPADAESAAGARIPEVEIEKALGEHRLVVAVTELSATAPLKLAAKRLGLRAVTMPGFGPEMLPALRLDWEEIHARCVALKALLDEASAAVIRCEARGRTTALRLDLRHRLATASGGLVREPGSAGNLPSGETYIVPYEGEREGDPSTSAGLLPLELEGELMLLRIAGNRVVGVEGDGPVARREREAFQAERGYANVAELGFGLLADYGLAPVGKVLLDEKLGLHVAFGRSDHFGGATGPAAFSSPERVVHIDRVYLRETQPRVAVRAVDLELDGGAIRPLMRDGAYVRVA